MKKLVEWMTEPLNSVKMDNLRRMGDDEVGEIHQEIAIFVNAHCHTDWTKQNAWGYLQYIKGKYNQATDISKPTGTGDTDKTKLRNDVLYVCPYYDTLKKVYDRRIMKYSDLAVESDSANVRPHFGSRTSSHVKLNENNGDSSGASSSDGDDSEDDATDGKPTLETKLAFYFHGSETHVSADTPDAKDGSYEEGNASALVRSSKRQKVCSKPEPEESLSKPGSATTKTGESCDGQVQHPHEVRERLRMIEEREKSLSVREKALAEREEAVTGKLLEYEVRHQEMLSRRQNDFEEMINRRQIDFEEMLNRLQKDYSQVNRQHRDFEMAKAQKNELRVEKAEFRKDKATLKEDREEFKQQQAKLRRRKADLERALWEL